MRKSNSSLPKDLGKADPGAAPCARSKSKAATEESTVGLLKIRDDIASVCAR